MQKQVPSVQVARKTVDVPQTQFIDREMVIPVVQQRQVPTVRTTWKILEIPPVQLLDKVVNMPVAVQRQVPMVQCEQKTLKVSQLQLISISAQRQSGNEDNLLTCNEVNCVDKKWCGTPSR